MKHSAPNPWRYGGILLEFTWKNDPTQVTLWGGRQAVVTPGDVVLILVTGQPAFPYCDVIPRERALRLQTAEG